jgi:farnesyl-diphosphate farnesyltransferase
MSIFTKEKRQLRSGMNNGAQQKLDRFKKRIIAGEIIDKAGYCAGMLDMVSRTFAFTIKILGSPLRKRVMVAYLLCRIADTIEDSTKLSSAQKARILKAYNDIIATEKKDTQWIHSLRGELSCFDTRDNEEFLVLYMNIVLSEYFSFDQKTKNAIRPMIAEMTAGMIETVEKSRDANRVRLSTAGELARYCHYVAGTVGHMLTHIFFLFSPWITKSRLTKLMRDEEAFGAGLQMTNIIKDAVKDLEYDVSYIPAEMTHRHDIVVEDLFASDHRQKAQLVMREMMVEAVKNLNLALRYTICLPKAEPRVRLFCLFPLFLAIRTLRKAADMDNLFEINCPVKISRREVKQVIYFSIGACLWDFLIYREYKKLLFVVEKKLNITTPLPVRQVSKLPVAVVC